MEASILIVSKNRKEDLWQTLTLLENYIDKSIHEIQVFLDGCTDNTEVLKKKYPWVKWHGDNKSIGASRARNLLYSKANGDILIGFDDDSHPLHSNFIEKCKSIFNDNPKVGIITFREIKGVYNEEILLNLTQNQKLMEYPCSEFIGCGFAIRRSVYISTNGFPVWIDIYGEESCLSLEVLSKNHEIFYTNTIAINHRVDINIRKTDGNNYFRFGKQLKNSTFYYFVYYRNPIKKIAKLYIHNLRKYALSDSKYLKIYLKTLFFCIFDLSNLLKYRNPINNEIIKMKEDLPFPGRN
jgi:hypothetical protein